MAEAVVGVEFAVRHDSAWFLAPVGSNEPTPLTLDGLLDRCSGLPDEHGFSLACGGGHQAADLAASDTIRPPWIVVGRITSSGLIVDDLAGGSALLDETDLRLLDCLTDVTTPAELSANVVDAAEGLQRIARLAGVGCVRTELSAPEVEVPEDVPAPSLAGDHGDPASGIAAVAHRLRTAYQLSSRLAPLRRVLGDESGDAGGSEQTPMVDASPATEPDPAPVAIELKERLRDLGDPEDGRIHVYPVWHTHVGPLLALGMLTAAARQWKGGTLTERYFIHRPMTAEEFLADIVRRESPAIMLSSDYVWSLEANLEVARAARALNENLVVLHGGPSSPKFEHDVEQFFDDHGEVAHVLTRSEGEETLCELLECLADTLPALDVDGLSGIAGISFRNPATGETVRTPDRERNAALDELPSPYLTGEFDHIDASAWNYAMAVETNRGCPYGCTFCDWGSSTLSRIRKFDLERVTHEFEWAAERGVVAMTIPDANFGIMSRDVQTAQRLADIRRRTGFPKVLVFYPAKNTTKHLSKIMDILGEADISSSAALSLQSTDAGILDALDRNNISTSHFVALAADYRRRGHPLQGDLLIGMPDQTYDTYRTDLQFVLDHEILARTWPVQILPNAPMNAPEYREKYGIVSDEDHLIVATNSFTVEDRAKMLRYRRIDLTADRYGVLRHVLRWMQWEKDVPANEVLDRVLTYVDTDPHRYPLLCWISSYFDLFPTAPGGWSSLYREVREFLREEFDVGDSPELDCVLAVQEFLMPSPGRSFPATLPLAHDYVSYFHDATSSLYTTGHAGTPPKPLAEYGPGQLTITGDPLSLCEAGIGVAGDSRSETMQGDFYVGSSVANELLSPLMRFLPRVNAAGVPPVYTGPPDYVPEHDEDPEIRAVAEDEPDPSAGIPVELMARS